MKFNKITAALCCAAGISASAGAVSLTADEQDVKALSQELTFADWMAEKNREKYADTTDQIIVKMNSSSDVTALMMSSETSFAANKNVNSVKGDKSLAVRGRQIMMDFNLKAGMPLEFVKSFQNDSVILKLSKELHVNDIEFITSRLATSAFSGGAEANPKRWLMAQNSPWGIASVQANQVSDATASNMTVCVIDSGYDINNPDLPSGATGTNDSGTGNWYVPGGSHGTHVAGTIAALNNSEGVVGVLPNNNVNLHIIKVFNASGWGYSSDLVDAIQKCQNAGSKVVNMSLGGPSSSTSERNAMQALEDSGILLVAAAGNDGDSSFSYPASYDAVVAVAAVDENGQHAEFSQYTSQVELSGPGEAVLSTVGVGDGRQGFITYNGSTTGDDRVLPQSRYVSSGGSFVISNVNATVSGALASCSRSGSTYSCGNMTGKICVAERNDNQSGSNYPEINAAEACADAGAAGVVVYSNTARVGLQNPFLVDANSAMTMPTVSVNRALGLDLVANAGSNATLEVRGGTDYAYYNGTSMASPHVAGVAALAWSNNINCTVSEVRNALKQTALDLDSAGRDNRTGWGMVQTKAASDYMAANCGGNNGGGNNGGTTALTNGSTLSGLSESQNGELDFTLEVPAGATDLSFAMSGGTGDADLYVRFGSEPTTSTYDCRPYASGNNESCPISNVQAGTYYVKIIGYSAFTGVSLTGSFTEPTSGGTGGSGSAVVSDSSGWQRDTIQIPAGTSSLTVSISGGTGDADLYVREGTRPTTSRYDCRPYKTGNNETCTFTNPGAGTWHVGIRAYSAYSNVTYTFEYE